jgi:flagellar biosynthetic protein FliR
VVFTIDPIQVRILLAVLLRLSLTFFLLPVFRTQAVPNHVKVLAVVSLTFMLFPLVRGELEPLPLNPAGLAGAVIGEILLGTVFALSMHLILGAFQMAGQLITFQMGLGFAQVVDPQYGTQEVLFSQWLQVIATLIFFSMDGHLVIVKALVESFRTIPLGGFLADARLYGKVLALSTQMFLIAVKIAAPVTAVLLITQAGLGIIAKFSPQINVLIVSFPLTIVLGLFFTLLSLPSWGHAVGLYLKTLFRFFQALQM